MPLLTKLSGIFEIKSKGRSFATFSKVIIKISCYVFRLKVDILYILSLYYIYIYILNIKILL